jgi:CBS domain-containing protein
MEDGTMFTLDAIMTTDLITVAPEATLADVRALMQEHRIHHIPVVGEKNTLIGLVTLTNVLAATDSILRNTETLEKHRIGCLPVVTGDKLRGIITDTDFVGVAINLLELLEETEPVDDDFAAAL